MLILSVTIAFLLLGALWLAAVLHEHGLTPMRRMAELMKRPAAEIALVALVAIGMIHHGATKGTNGVNGAGGEMGGTNGVQNMGGVLTGLMGLTGFGDGGSALPNLDLQPSTLNPLPPTTNSDWLAFGGYDDWFYLDGGGWCFRFGSNLVERLTVLSCGEISPAPYDASNRISLLGLPLAILPAVNWHLLGNGEQGTGNGEQGTGNGEQGTGNGEQGNHQPPTTNYQLKSFFCHEETPSNTLLLTWRNALVNRDTDLPVTVQAELFPDGAAAFRYDFSGVGDISALSNAEAQIWRDGAIASNYQLPIIDYQLSTTNYQLSSFFDAPPITGTNLVAEVYARIAGGNSNAYYCADVVVEKGPAKIRVEPLEDEINQGLLGAYEIVAMPGETNRLPFLIGPKYAVTAESAFGSFELVPPPFLPIGADTNGVEWRMFGDALTVTNVADRLVEVEWPVTFRLEAIDATPETATYALRVTPDWLGGALTWHGIDDTNAPPMRGSPPMRSGGISCSCGCLSRDGADLIHSLACGCEHCYAEGEYGYENHSGVFSCDMKNVDDGGGDAPGGEDEGDDPPEPDLPWVSVAFEDSVVIFENEYTNSPGVTVPRRSTRTKLTLTAHGGDFGCAFTYQAPNEEKMLRVDGGSPPPSYVSADSDIEWTAYYEGIKASTQMNDLHAMVTYTDPVTGQTHQPCTDATVVEIRVSPSTEAPENNCSGRHKYGVCEVVNCLQTPSTPKVVWTATSGSFKESASYVDFICPLYATSNPLEANIGDVVFVPNISVVEPQGIIATNAVNINYGEHPNKAGYVGMQLQLYVRPMDVSFDEIAVEEVPSDQGEHFGHFTNTYFSSRWSHTRTNGAGDWIDVGSKAEGEEGEFPNRFGVDTAAYEGVLPCFRPDGMAIAPPDSTTSWSYGYMYWANPFGWNIKGTKGYTAPFREFATSTIDEFYILLDGTMSILKLQNTVTRMTNDCVYLNGVLQ